MLTLSLRMSCIAALLMSLSVAGINWKAVWLEQNPVVLTVGERQPYVVMGLNGADTKADLTKSKYLNITSSDPSVLEIDRETGVFVGDKPGYVGVNLGFSEARAIIPAFVRPPTTASASPAVGVWRAVFTGDMSQRPKMVSEILFDVTPNGSSLTGTVHAASWPGDAPISNGKVEGDRVSFQMIGHLPFQTGTAGVMVTGFPKLCFSGIVQNAEMKIDLLWTEASRLCEDGKLMPMAGKKLAN